MGVRGLQSFLKRNHNIAETTDVRNTNIVIDGNNVMCFLFISLAQQGSQAKNDIYGGDMVAYGETVKEFFTNLDKCKITPILVFDGSVIGKQSTKDKLALKEKTIYQRGLDRFQKVKYTNYEVSPDGDTIHPQIIRDVFKDIISDMGIQSVQTPYEADSHIAKIANDLNCLVVSNDSDFIVYPLPKGFILLDSFAYKNPIAGRDGQAIRCQIYSQAKLIRSVRGLTGENMPLLSILLGNDYVEAGTFDRVLQSICFGPYNGPLETYNFNTRKIANLLTWLGTKSLNEAIEYITGQLQSGNRDSLRQVIIILLRSYKIEELENFEDELREIYPIDKVDPNANIHPELMPPAYLLRLMETANLSTLALDIIFHNTYYNYALIDDFQLTSSSYVKYRPFSVAVTLLRPKCYNNMTTYRRQVESEKDAFKVYDRIRDEYCPIKITPIEKIEVFGSLEHLDCYSNITLEPALKKSLLMTTFRFNLDEYNLMNDTLSLVFSDAFVQEYCICLMLIKYIGQETKSSPKGEFVDAILLTSFFYAALNGKLNKESFQDSHYGHLLLTLRPHSIMNNGINYEPINPNLYRRIVHFISQLQCAYQAYRFLNSLLDHVYLTPRIERFFNGVLIYRLTKMLRLGTLKMNDLCKNMPVLLDACNSVKIMVHCDG